MADSDCRIDARFIPGADEQLFTIEFRPLGQPRGVLLIVPPFAEEMNKSRHMLSSQARLLAGEGYRVVFPDLGGTGDSHGDFGSATWEAWCGDIARVAEAAGEEADVPLTLLGLRLGGLLALAAMRQHALAADKLVLWSPCLDGAAFMAQFLRLRLMSSMIGKAERKETVASLTEQLLADNSLEVAGYEISPALYRSIATQNLTELMEGVTAPVRWFELVPDGQTALPAAAAKAVAGLTGSGCSIEAEAVQGPKFWSTAEITTAPLLGQRTLACMNEPAP